MRHRGAAPDGHHVAQLARHHDVGVPEGGGAPVEDGEDFGDLAALLDLAAAQRLVCSVEALMQPRPWPASAWRCRPNASCCPRSVPARCGRCWRTFRCRRCGGRRRSPGAGCRSRRCARCSDGWRSAFVRAPHGKSPPTGTRPKQSLKTLPGEPARTASDACPRRPETWRALTVLPLERAAEHDARARHRPGMLAD